MIKKINVPNWVYWNGEWLHVQKVEENGHIQTFINGELNTTYDANGAIVFDGVNDYIDLSLSCKRDVKDC